MKAVLLLALGVSMSAANADWNSRSNWKDSYAVDGKCYCSFNGLDHGPDNNDRRHANGRLSVVQICSDIRDVLGKSKKTPALSVKLRKISYRSEKCQQEFDSVIDSRNWSLC